MEGIKMFTMEADDAKKTFLLYADGFFKVPDAEAFIAEYNRQIAKFNPKEYALIVDVRKLMPGGPDVTPYMEKVIKMYVTTPFKRRFMVVMENVITNIQVKRLGQDTLDDFEYVVSVQQALLRLK
jgi:hypothetical protein